MVRAGGGGENPAGAKQAECPLVKLAIPLFCRRNILLALCERGRIENDKIVGLSAFHRIVEKMKNILRFEFNGARALVQFGICGGALQGRFGNVHCGNVLCRSSRGMKRKAALVAKTIEDAGVLREARNRLPVLALI